MPRYLWFAEYGDGTRVSHRDMEGRVEASSFGSADDIDRDRVVRFELWDPEHPDLTRTTLHLESPRMRLIYRCRRFIRAGGSELPPIHILGWQECVNDRNRQAIAWVREGGGIDITGRFKRGHAVFDEIVYRTFELPEEEGD